MGPYVLVFGAAAGVTFLATPLVRRLALRVGWVDRPSDRKVHPKPTPTAGGLAIFLGVVAGLVVAGFNPFLAGLHQTTSDPEAALLAGAVILVVGLLDDARGISVLGKLAGQVLAAGLVVLAGVQLLYFYFPGQGILSLDQSLGVPVTVLWVVAMVNAVNLIDGLDGLAAGIVAIGALSFFAYMFGAPGSSGEPSAAALLAAIAAGSALGFLPWNFHPARIFMGDSGAMLLGMMMAVATISGVGRNAYAPGGGFFAAVAIPVALPLFVLAVPFLDVLLAIVRRVRSGLGITHADKEHIHHHLLEVGHTHRQAVMLMYLWSALISGSALAVAFIDGRLLVGAILLLVGAVLAVTMLPRMIKSGERAGREPLAVPGGPPEEPAPPAPRPPVVEEHTA